MNERQRRELIERYSPVMRAIVHTFGLGAEVVLHDLETPDRSIICIEGNVTGRRVGGALTDLGLSLLRAGDDARSDLYGYISRTPHGRQLRSSSIFVRNRSGRVVGALCVNFDITALAGVHGMAEPLLEPASRGVRETFADEPERVLSAMCREAADSLGIPLSRPGRTERLRLVAELERRGAFLLQRSIPIVSGLLGVSRFTLYNDLKAATGAEKVYRRPARAVRGGA